MCVASQHFHCRTCTGGGGIAAAAAAAATRIGRINPVGSSCFQAEEEEKRPNSFYSFPILPFLETVNLVDAMFHEQSQILQELVWTKSTQFIHTLTLSQVHQDVSVQKHFKHFTGLKTLKWTESHFEMPIFDTHIPGQLGRLVLGKIETHGHYEAIVGQIVHLRKRKGNAKTLILDLHTTYRQACSLRVLEPY